jgi:hypothetical protein
VSDGTGHAAGWTLGLTWRARALLVLSLTAASLGCHRQAATGPHVQAAADRVPALGTIPVGSWSEYLGTDGRGTHLQRVALVARDASTVTIETEVRDTNASPEATLSSRALIAVTGYFGDPPLEAAMQVGNNDPMTAPQSGLPAPTPALGRLEARSFVGVEPLQTTAGTFKALHYRAAVAAGTYDAWLCPEVLPLGLCKSVLSSSTGTSGLELVRQGGGATARIVKRPAAYDEERYRRQFLAALRAKE